MWCTRWFLPLLLLPLPTAPPYFLLLFLFSLTLHAKPCFYCIVLLTTLFVSSCYWQPFPLDSPLSTPWTDNITTFAEALRSTITPNYSEPLPDVMRTVDRCWCDFSSSGFFEPFNVSHWEYVSVQRLKEDLEHEQMAEEMDMEKTQIVEVSTDASPMPHITAPASVSVPPGIVNIGSIDIWTLLFYPFYRGPSYRPSLPRSSTPISPKPQTKGESNTEPNQNLPLIRREYDLRPHGLGIVIDFGWTR